MPDAAEIALIQRCQEGREDAFRELVERYQRRTFWIAYNMVGNQETAREISQEAFVRVFRNIRRFDVRKNFYTWLYQIVVNLSIDHVRKASHARTVDLDGVGGLADPARRDPSESGERAETRRRVHQALDRLPPKYKAVLTLRDIQGFSCEEIAEIVGCTNATVRWRLHRARRLFKAVWEGKGVQIGDEGEASER
ncbi:MAG TPA: sigma-70 family RNA polymerase sigma factor [Planctomycetota bacterium]|jgi:RNA polymerase sigma-70 factor (ECF subfamily)|nr:sigma-70 family RNA polymerase sigma factor [Planctomycetota bacterium]